MTGRLETRARLRNELDADDIRRSVELALESGYERAPCDPVGAASNGDKLTRQLKTTVRAANERPGADSGQSAGVHNLTANYPDLAIGAQDAPSCQQVDQRAHYPEDWHPLEYYLQRVRLFAWIAAIGLAGAVVWMVASA